MSHDTSSRSAAASGVVLQSFTWYFLRISGLLMLVLVLVHLLLMHYARTPSSTNATFVSGRWGDPGWRIFDAALLILTLTHGMAGVHNMLREMSALRRLRRAVDAGFLVLTSLFVALGAVAIAIFIPATASTTGPLSAERWIPAALDAALVVVATLTYLAVLVIGVTLATRLARHRPIGWWNYPGQWAFALNRASGIGILAFLLVHVLDIALFPLAPDLYDATVASYAIPYLLPMEAALVGAVIYHALGGLRLMLLEFLAPRVKRAEVPSFVGVVALTIVLVLPSLVVLLR